MKTQVIQLDPHDDLTSIRDKVSWAKTPRILLVLPRRSRLRLRNLDLRLLRRHAALLGTQLAFVSRSREFRRAAQAEGIPAFRVVSVAQRKKWDMPVPVDTPQRQNPPPDLWKLRREVYSDRQGWQDLPSVRIVFFTLAVLTVLVLLLLFLPSATIQLAPATRLQKLTLPVSAGPTVTTVNLAGSIPARSLSMFVEKNKTASVTGQIPIPAGQAAGKVRFRNLTGSEITIPAGTIIRTVDNPPVRFATVADVIVAGTAGKTEDVPVKAVNGGGSGNLPAETLVSIEGDLGASLAVTNPAPTTGGTDRQVLAPTATDRTRLRNVLQEEILGDCRDSFKQTAGEGSLLFPDTLKVSQVISETYIPAEGQAGDTLSLTLNVQCQLEYASAADILALAEKGLDVNLPTGFEPVPEGAVASVAGPDHNQF